MCVLIRTLAPNTSDMDKPVDYSQLSNPVSHADRQAASTNASFASPANVRGQQTTIIHLAHCVQDSAYSTKLIFGQA